MAQRILSLGYWTCFAVGTPLLTPDGSKPIEQFKVGDLVLSRDENTPEGPVEAKMVVEVLVRTGRILHVHVGGQVIRTTSEHPFWVQGKGWLSAGFLRPGNLLSSHDGQWVAVEEVYESRDCETVYNLQISDYHTYFVGSPQWSFSVWAHNDSCRTVLNGFRNQMFKYGSNLFRLGRQGMKHILERHHPRFFQPSQANGKQITTFLSQGETVQSIMGKVAAIMEQNKAVLSQAGASGRMFQITGTIGGRTYTVGFRFGNIGQFFPH
jgi:hypothetical protein